MTITVTRFDVNQGTLFLEGEWPEEVLIDDGTNPVVFFKFKMNSILVPWA
jgi:hypothetical protein